MGVDATQWRIAVLDMRHDRDAFSCGTPALDRYLRQQARQDADKRVAVPFVLTAPPAMGVLGYYTLCASVVNVPDLPQALAKRLPRYPRLPVTLLGRLAVDESAKRQGIGQFLLMDALRRSVEATAEVAAMAVVVDAKDDMALAFYRRYGFEALQQQPRRLYLPMKTISRLFE